MHPDLSPDAGLLAPILHILPLPSARPCKVAPSWCDDRYRADCRVSLGSLTAAFQRAVQNAPLTLVVLSLLPFLFPVPICQIWAAQSCERINFCALCECTKYSLLCGEECTALQDFREE